MLPLAGNILLLMCYCTICGWMLQYFIDTAVGKFVGLDVAAIGDMFGAMTQNTGSMAFYTLTVVLVTIVCSFSLQKGPGAGHQVDDAGTAEHHDHSRNQQLPALVQARVLSSSAA